MARILLNLKDEKIRNIAVKALSETRHTVIEVDDLGQDRGLTPAADKIIQEQAEVVIMDYWPEDAAGVKLMQAVSDHEAQPPEFIFIESGEEAPRDQVLMAINEGARAFLPKNFTSSALLNYVERSVGDSGRLCAKTLDIHHASEAAIAHVEELLGLTRAKADGYQKLVAYLMATPTSSQPRKILVVSDSPYQMEMLKKILEEHNFSVLTAGNLSDGLNIALNEQPRIIISDLELEGQTGLEFCQAVKFTHKLIPCYFVICTANQDKIAKVMVPGNGVDDCLVKPFGQSPSDTAEFISRVAMGLLL